MTHKTLKKTVLGLAALCASLALATPRAEAVNAAQLMQAYTQQAAQPVSQLVATGDAARPFRYVRADFSVNFTSGTRAWTEREARLIQNAMDLLPIGYLRRARAGGLDRLERQAGSAHVGAIASGATGISPPFLGYIGLGDAGFPTNVDGGAQQRLANKLMCHELGHQVEWGMGAVWYVRGSAFTPISWDPVVKVPWFGVRNLDSFATDYSLTNPWEDFAEACKLYWYQPDDLRAHSQAKYDYMRNHVFDGVESDPSIRFQTSNVRPFVTPHVDGLSTGDAGRLSFITIHGHDWLDMWDGGFTRVRFGGHAAVTSMAVSRQTIYAEVPYIDTGSQPVTVATGDGTSNAASFQVTKPWWQFW